MKTLLRLNHELSGISGRAHTLESGRFLFHVWLRVKRRHAEWRVVVSLPGSLQPHPHVRTKVFASAKVLCVYLIIIPGAARGPDHAEMVYKTMTIMVVIVYQKLCRSRSAMV